MKPTSLAYEQNKGCVATEVISSRHYIQKTKEWRRGGLMAVACLTPDQAVRVRALPGVIALCS